MLQWFFFLFSTHNKLCNELLVSVIYMLGCLREMSSRYCSFQSGSERASLLLGRILWLRQWMLWLMSYCGACSPFVCSEPAGLKHPSCSPASPNGIRKRVDRFQYSVKEYLIWGLADSINSKARWEGMSTGVIAAWLKVGHFNLENSCGTTPPTYKKHILYTHYQRTVKGQHAISASVQISVIHCCE